MRSKDPAWGRVAREKLPERCCGGDPGRGEQASMACSAGPRLNRYKFTMNEFGLCIRRIWESFPHVGKPMKIATPFGKCNVDFGTGEARAGSCGM